jgi:hypothetical protein
MSAISEEDELKAVWLVGDDGGGLHLHHTRSGGAASPPVGAIMLAADFQDVTRCRVGGPDGGIEAKRGLAGLHPERNLAGMEVLNAGERGVRRAIRVDIRAAQRGTLGNDGAELSE